MSSAFHDRRDLLFEQHIHLIAGPHSGLTVALLRRIGSEHGIMPDIESLVTEFADLFPHDSERFDVDIKQNRPRFLVIEGDEL